MTAPGRPRGALRDLVASTGIADETTDTRTVDERLADPAVQALIERALPPRVGLDLDRFLAVCANVQRDDHMLKLVPAGDMIDMFIRVAALGLEPNTALEHVFLRSVPVENSPLRAVEMILGYKGMIAIALRSPEIEGIEAHVVHQNDEFAFEQGTDSYLMHSWEIDDDRGAVRGYYGIARFTGGARPRFWPISLAEIDEHKAFSLTADDPNSLWQTRPIQMGLKTVIRIMFPMLPIQADAADAAAADGIIAGPDGAADVSEGDPDPGSEPQGEPEA